RHVTIRSQRDEVEEPAPRMSETRALAPQASQRHASAPEDVIYLSDVGATLLAKSRRIAACALLASGIGLAGTLLMRPSFTAQGRLFLGDIEKALPRSQSTFELATANITDVSSEMDIVRSESIMFRAIDRAGLNVMVVPEGGKRLRMAGWLLRGKDPATLDPALAKIRIVHADIDAGEVGLAQVTLRFTSPNEFEVTQEGHQAVRGKLGEPLRAGPARFEVVKAHATAAFSNGEAYVAHIGSQASAEGTAQDKLVISSTRVSPTEQGRVLTLSYSDPSPRRAQAFVQALMDAYLEERQAWKNTSATSAEQFISDQLNTLRSSLQGVESQLADYRSSHGSLLMDTEAKALVEQVGRFEQQRVAARLELTALNAFKRATSDPKAPLEAYLLGDERDPLLLNMTTALTEARQAMTQVEQKFSPDSTEYKAQAAQVESRAQAVNNYVSTRLVRAHEHMASLSNVVAQLEQKLKGVPGAEAGIEKASTLSRNRVLDWARLPGAADGPKLAKGMGLGVLGLFFGIAWVLFERFGSIRLQAAVDARRLAPEAAFLGTMPDVSSLAAGGHAASVDWVSSPIIEAFRRIRARIYGLPGLRDGGIVLFTSPDAGAGKTTAVQWIAAAIAADGKRVLVIDADLRTPSRSGIPGTRIAGPCLHSVLTGKSPWSACVRRAEYLGQTVTTLGTSVPAPAELLSGDAMQQLLTEARCSYDYILIDAPEYPEKADVLALARYAEGIVSIVRLQSTRHRAIPEQMRTLHALDAKVAILVNDARTAQPLPSFLREIRRRSA
ncbi:MAG: hypothetical protein RL385_1708, partial [Pseudomonadota bacterium]